MKIEELGWPRDRRKWEKREIGNVPKMGIYRRPREQKRQRDRRRREADEN